MSAHTHTPGPWIVVNVGGVRTIKSTVQAGYFAEVRGACQGAHGAEGDANAALIASAPDLLAALRNLVDAAEDDSALQRDRRRAAVGAARTAIARAEGVRP